RRGDEARAVVVGDADEDDAAARPDRLDRVGKRALGACSLEGDVEAEAAARELARVDRFGGAGRERGRTAMRQRVGGDDGLAARGADRLDEQEADRATPEDAGARPATHVAEVERVQRDAERLE